MTMADTKCRKWALTINNPAEHDFSHDKIKEALVKMKPVVYWCMADEKGETHHTHLYIHNRTPVRFSTIKKAFPPAHIEEARGTAQENREYVAKEGKWLTDEKCGTKIDGTFEEWGELPQERQGARTDLAELYELILDGKNNCEIYQRNPDFIKYYGMIENIRQDHRYNEWKDKDRDITVIYVYGKTRIGKTRMVMGAHCREDIYRVTDYKHPFDSYTGEKIIVFDEFRSQLPITDMNNYLDHYPLKLPARYTNRQACYTVVYILSNLPLIAQYPNVRREQREVWEAFYSRIHKLYEMTEDGLQEQDIQAHVTGSWVQDSTPFVEIDTQEELPF
jgi:hypothetical protein